jgi:hypothetical protein
MSSEYLEHHGVKGMKWGVIRETADAASNMTNHAKNINQSVGNLRRSKSKKEDISSMSDEDLKKRVSRMNMEQQYSKLTSEKTAKGQTYVKDILDLAGGALGIAGSIAAIALAIKSLKG